MTARSALLRVVLVELLAAAALLLERLGEGGLVVVEAVDRVVHGVVDLGLHDLLGQRDLGLLEQRLERLVADLLGLLDALDPLDLIGEVALSSSMVSNSLASWANSSSASGSSRSLTELDGDGHLRPPRRRARPRPAWW